MPFITIDEFLVDIPQCPVIDTRSNHSFLLGHFPNALNIPTILNSGKVRFYLTQTYPDSHIFPEDLIGNWESVNRKIQSNLKRQASLFYCEDGGIQSKILSFFLERQRPDSFFLQGGFQEFQQYQRRYFHRPLNIRLLTGLTGCGKTRVLQALQALGEQAVNLERLSGETGSAFGKNSHVSQPSKQEFYNRIWEQLRSLDLEKRIFFEQKGSFIGDLSIPEGLFNQFKSAKKIELLVPKDQRVRNLKMTYGALDPEDIQNALAKIRKNMAPKVYSACKDALQNRDNGRFIRNILPYYDQSRGYAPSQEPDTLRIDGSNRSTLEMAKEILNRAA